AVDGAAQGLEGNLAALALAPERQQQLPRVGAQRIGGAQIEAAPSSRRPQALRRAIYRPARSTDILLREFISAGPNEGDLAFVYEAGARQRAPEAVQRWPGGYRLLVPDPTIEVVPAAAVLAGAASGRPGDGELLVAFLAGPKGQAILQSTGYTAAGAKGAPPGGQGGTAVASTERERAGGAAAPLAAGGGLSQQALQVGEPLDVHGG
ncbi:MAG: hypothetical protein ACKOOH_09515, partial [Cyanobium sp.]